MSQDVSRPHLTKPSTAAQGVGAPAGAALSDAVHDAAARRVSAQGDVARDAAVRGVAAAAAHSGTNQARPGRAWRAHEKPGEAQQRQERQRRSKKTIGRFGGALEMPVKGRRSPAEPQEERGRNPEESTKSRNGQEKPR